MTGVEIAKHCPFSEGHLNVSVYERDWDGCSRPWQPACWVYSLMASAGGVLYVGIAHDVNARWKQHSKSKAWWPEVDGAVVERHCCRRHALTAEAFAICDGDATYNLARPRHQHRMELRTWTDVLVIDDISVGVPA